MDEVNSKMEKLKNDLEIEVNLGTIENDAIPITFNSAYKFLNDKKREYVLRKENNGGYGLSYLLEGKVVHNNVGCDLKSQCFSLKARNDFMPETEFRSSNLDGFKKEIKKMLAESKRAAQKAALDFVIRQKMKKELEDEIRVGTKQNQLRLVTLNTAEEFLTAAKREYVIRLASRGDCVLSYLLEGKVVHNNIEIHFDPELDRPCFFLMARNDFLPNVKYKSITVEGLNEKIEEMLQASRIGKIERSERIEQRIQKVKLAIGSNEHADAILKIINSA